MIQKVQYNAEDVDIIVTVTDQNSGDPIDLSGASQTNYIFQDPIGTQHTVQASFYTNGKDGMLIYTTIAGDLTTSNGRGGQWVVQVDAIIPGVYIGRSSITQFEVGSNL